MGALPATAQVLLHFKQADVAEMEREAAEQEEATESMQGTPQGQAQAAFEGAEPGDDAYYTYDDPDQGEDDETPSYGGSDDAPRYE